MKKFYNEVENLIKEYKNLKKENSRLSDQNKSMEHLLNTDLVKENLEMKKKIEKAESKISGIIEKIEERL